MPFLQVVKIQTDSGRFSLKLLSQKRIWVFGLILSTLGDLFASNMHLTAIVYVLFLQHVG